MDQNHYSANTLIRISKYKISGTNDIFHLAPPFSSPRARPYLAAPPRPCEEETNDSLPTFRSRRRPGCQANEAPTPSRPTPRAAFLLTMQAAHVTRSRVPSLAARSLWRGECALYIYHSLLLLIQRLMRRGLSDVSENLPLNIEVFVLSVHSTQRARCPTLACPNNFSQTPRLKWNRLLSYCSPISSISFHLGNMPKITCLLPGHSSFPNMQLPVLSRGLSPAVCSPARAPI